MLVFLLKLFSISFLPSARFGVDMASAIELMRLSLKSLLCVKAMQRLHYFNEEARASGEVFDPSKMTSRSFVFCVMGNLNDISTCTFTIFSFF